jgi:hypothetical protein
MIYTLTIVGSDNAISSLEPGIRALLPHCFEQDNMPQVDTCLTIELKGKTPQLVITGSSMNTPDQGIVATSRGIIDYVRRATGQHTPVIVFHGAPGDKSPIFNDDASLELQSSLQLGVAIRAVLNLPLA